MDSLYAGRWPEYTKNGVWQYRQKVNWLSGFLAGEHWLLFDLTGNPIHEQRALEQSNRLLDYSGIDYTHDMGFIFLPSIVASYDHAPAPEWREAIIRSAEMLARRYNGNGRFIRAWGKLGSEEERAGWMIIDTMMNLELLFRAAELSRNPEFYRVAYSHALTTLNVAFRSDGSTYHVIEFDPHTGKVLKKRTHQGLGDETTWARGQAWAVAGFAMAYRYTRDERFLEAASRAADYYLDKLGEAGRLIPTWDLSLLEDAEAPRDASAAAILACGLYDLAAQTVDPGSYATWSDWADRIVGKLVADYTFLSSPRPQEGLLIHTVYNYHKQWGVDESFPPGDYYFLKSLQLHMGSNRTVDLSSLVQTPGRQRVRFNQRWRYQAGGTEPTRSGMVDLPHTWNTTDVMDSEPGYRRGLGIYTKEIRIPPDLGNRKLFLEFEAANTVAHVYLNEREVGSHIGGYLGFSVDLTPAVIFGAVNRLRVEVDNSVNPDVIPSQKSDFFIYGGLIRDVWLNLVPDLSLGVVEVMSPQVTREKAATTFRVDISGAKAGEDLQIRARLLDPDGTVVLDQDFPEGSGEYRFPDLVRPRLWAPSHPELYQLEVDLMRDGRIVDSRSTQFGYRWFEFKAHGAFYLNGERLLLRGTHRHEEWAGYGAAMPDSLHRKDMEMIKSMGANFVRLAHYPQDPSVYQACDELGLLVWDELPWCRGGAGGATWKANTETMLRELIIQNRNHPSIIIWSLGNELYWLPDFPGGDADSLLRGELANLNQIAHELDPSRVTAIRKYYDGADIVDVFSPSIWAGWYSGVYTNYPLAIEKSRKKYPRFLHMEYGGASHVGRHDEYPIDGSGLDVSEGWEEAPTQTKVKNVARVGDWSENYIVDLFDYHLSISETLPDFTGNAQWAFRDFGTPLRPENSIPYVNQKGLLDREGNPKDAWYVFRSYWDQETPFCYIESHTWQDRSGPEGKPREVCVYSNCESVELFLNGTSHGIHRRTRGALPAQGLVWNILFEPGDNHLSAIGSFPGQEEPVRDEMDLVYHTRPAGKPTEIRLSASELPNGNHLVTATVLDGEGQRCTDYNQRVYFWCDTPGRIHRNRGTPTGSEIIEFASGAASIQVKAVPGEQLRIEARNQDFKGSYLILEGALPTSGEEGR